VAGKRQLPPVTIAPKDSEESRLDRLRKIRRVLEGHIYSENTLARDLSPLVRQAREISLEIEELEQEQADLVEVNVIDGDSSEDAPFRLEAV
jgi:hypothetical protein